MPRLEADIHARIPLWMRDQLTAYAVHRDVSRGTVVRWAVESFLGDHPTTAEDAGQGELAPWVDSSFRTGSPARSTSTTNGEKR